MPTLDESATFLETFGYLVIPAMLTPAATEALRTGAESAWAADAGGGLGELDERQQVNGFVEHDPALWWLVEQEPLWHYLTRFLGSGFVWLGSEANRYTGDTGWHPDGSEHRLTRVKVIFYLQPVDRDNGALRVIPGSHRDPYHSMLRPLIQRPGKITLYGVRAPRRTRIDTPVFGVPANEIPATALPVEPGDAIIINQNVWHSSFGGGTDRRMVAMSFAQEPRSQTQLDILREIYRGQLAHATMRQLAPLTSLYADFPRSDSARVSTVSRTIRELGLA